jgi:hypothetical protein
MELVEGRTLTQLLPKSGFSLERLLEIAIPLADAVSRAHRAGITHRDLKPDNIMIDDEGRLRVLDFGLAKLQESTAKTPDTQVATVTSDTAEGRVLGTVAYMSPEQAEGKEVDARSDIFSLGTILYEMFTGRRPFRGDTTMSTIGSILKDEPSSVTDLKPMLPRHAARILRRCLAKDPDRRYQTALDLRNELEELRDEPPAPSMQRRPVWPVLVAAVALVALAVVITVQLLVREPVAVVYFSRPITATTEWDSGPTWSPDGKVVTFDRMSRGNSDIYVKPVDGGEEVSRTALPGEQLGPRWTPDGRYLTFISRHLPGNPVMLVPADGGEPTELIKTHTHTLSFEGPPMGVRPWSADGKILLLALEDENGSFAIHRVDRETGQAEQITFPPEGAHDSIATYSFDGKRILFRRVAEVRARLMLIF